MAVFEPKVFAFVFPMASGHINPSLPMARALVGLGHRVHYLCREQMREAIEDTGAVFHSDVEAEKELYATREPDIFGAFATLKKERDLESENFVHAIFKLRNIQREMMLPGVTRWLRALGAHAVAYCPLMNTETAIAAAALGIPSVALLTTAGPGSTTPSFEEFLSQAGVTAEELRQVTREYLPNVEAAARTSSDYGVHIPLSEGLAPLGKLDLLRLSVVTLVTTCEDLQDPLMPELAREYEQEGVRFEAVGALLDQDGAKRAVGHKYKQGEASGDAHAAPAADQPDGADLMARVRAARAAGRPVVLASMGTVVTGDHEEIGWEGRMRGADGQPHGLTGRELCRAAWGGVFDAFGRPAAEEGPLVVVALGPQRDALGEVPAPANAVCLPSVPQVEVLKAGVDVFLTHGGQNSFTEALSSAVPVVVCPGFGDQATNAKKAEAMGVGLQVPRPEPAEGGEASAAEAFRQSVATALRRVAAEPPFKQRASGCAERLARAGGVPRAVQWMLAAAEGAADPAAARGAEKVLEGPPNAQPRLRLAGA